MLLLQSNIPPHKLGYVPLQLRCVYFLPCPRPTLAVPGRGAACLPLPGPCCCFLRINTRLLSSKINKGYLKIE